jgi:hypothetical protein
MFMIHFLKEFYLAEFAFFYRASSKSWSHGYNTGKGVAGVSLVLSLILLTICGWIEILTGKQYLPVLPQWETWIASLAFIFVNYYVLVIRGHGIRFEREFNNFTKSKQNVLRVSCLAVTLTSAAFFICSAYAYQHFFHIIPKQ